MTCQPDELARRIGEVVQRVALIFACRPYGWFDAGDFALAWHITTGENLPGINEARGFGFYEQLQRSAILTLFVPIPGRLWVRLHPTLAELVADTYRSVPRPTARPTPVRYQPYPVGRPRAPRPAQAGRTPPGTIHHRPAGPAETGRENPARRPVPIGQETPVSDPEGPGEVNRRRVSRTGPRSPV